jgi:MFS family permease
LPVLNRLGQSVAPFLLARRLKLLPRKRRELLLSTLAMAVPFGALALGLAGFGAVPRPWYPAAFLALYTLFFAASGLNLIAAGTLHGKLIRANRRGRLLAIATMGGTLPACLCAWYLLPGWLARPDGYARIFGFTALFFAIAALAVLFIREPKDRFDEPAQRLSELLGGAWRLLRDDANYRLLVLVSALFTTSLILLPHYQALGRDRLGLAGGNLMLWVVWQNAAVGLASLVSGPFADRFGNRLALRVTLFAASLVPLFALTLSHLPGDLGRELFPLVFVGIGITPIALRLTANYVLEISPAAEHPRYLSLSQLCTAAVLVTSPGFGWMIDAAGYDGVFSVVAALIAAGGVLTFRLAEPRERR